MHSVLKLQRNTFSFKIKEVAALYPFSIQNTAISILWFIWDVEIHQALGIKWKEFHILAADRVESVCVFYMKSDTRSRNQQMFRKKFNLPSKCEMYSINTKKEKIK
jgi:hypothetical protein